MHRGECSRSTAAVEAEGLVCSQATVLLLCCSFRPKPLIALRPVPALKGAIMFPSSKQLTVGVFFFLSVEQSLNAFLPSNLDSIRDYLLPDKAAVQSVS